MSSSDVETEPTGCVICGSTQAIREASGKDYLHRTSDQDYRFCRCLSCGHLYLNPRPTINEIGRIYPADYATRARRFGRANSLLAKIKDRVLLGRFDVVADRLPKSMRLLDIGCGDGRFLLALRRRFPEARLTGLDWTFGPNVAEELATANIETITGAIETAVLPQDHYDVITMNQIIEHVWDVRSVFERCRQALKPDGLLPSRRRIRMDGTVASSNPADGEAITGLAISICSPAPTCQASLPPPACRSSSRTRSWLRHAGSIHVSSRPSAPGWATGSTSSSRIPARRCWPCSPRSTALALLLGAETSNQKLVARRVR